MGAKKAFSDEKPKIKLHLVLQGGGAYGAFTKGALIRLLQDPRVQSGEIEIIGVSGTSAGAMNAVPLVAGLNGKGPAEAAQLLDKLWGKIATPSVLYPNANPFLAPFLPKDYQWPNLPQVDIANSAGRAGDSATRSTINMMGIFNPMGARVMKIWYQAVQRLKEQSWVLDHLRGALNETLTDKHWANIRRTDGVRAYLNTALEDPKTGNLVSYVFDQPQLRARNVVGCASLSMLGSYNLEGKRMRDGAYLRNPCMKAATEQEGVTDVMVITLHGKPKASITAQHQDDEPSSALPFAGFEAKKEQIHANMTHLLDDPNRRFNLHEIAYNPPSWHQDSARINTDERWLAQLSREGYQAADLWLQNLGSRLGVTSTYIPPITIKRGRALNAA